MTQLAVPSLAVNWTQVEYNLTTCSELKSAPKRWEMSQQQPGQTAEGRRQLSRGMSNHEVGLSRSGSRSGSRGGTLIVHGGPSSRDALSLHGGTNTP